MKRTLAALAGLVRTPTVVIPGAGLAGITLFVVGVGWLALLVTPVVIGAVALHQWWSENEIGGVSSRLGWFLSLSLLVTSFGVGALEDLTVTAGNDSTLADPWKTLSYATLWPLAVLILPFALGVASGHWQTLIGVAFRYAGPLILADLLWYDRARDACGGTADLCDPGPFPATFLVILLPLAVWPAAAFGVALRQSRVRRQLAR